MSDRSIGNPLVDRLKGKAKRAAGTVLGDGALRHEGELHEEKADALVEAAELEERAALDEREAELKRRAEELDAEQRGLAVDAASDARAELIEQDEQRTIDAAERQQAIEAQAAETQAAAADRAASAQEERAAQEDHAAIADALRLQAEADRASLEAEALASAADTIQES